MVEIEIARERTQLRRLGNPAERIFRSNLCQLQRGFHHAVETLAGKVAGVGAGSALPEENAHADGLRAGLFQSFDLAEANQGGEFVAFANHAFGGSGAAVHGAAHDVLGEIAQVNFELGTSSFDLSGSHKKILDYRSTEDADDRERTKNFSTSGR